MRWNLPKSKVEANFEFCEKLGVPFFCFHDRDIAPEGTRLKETNKRLDEITALIKERMKNSNVKLFGELQMLLAIQDLYMALPHLQMQMYLLLQLLRLKKLWR